jgi:outer membrane protein
MARILGSLLATSVLVVSPLLAQEPAVPTTLSLNQAVRQSLAHNPGLLAATAGVEESVAQASGTKASRWPKLSFSESWQRGNQPVFVFGSLLGARRFTSQNFAIDALNRPDAVDSFRSAVQVEQVIFDGGRTGAAVDSAARGREVAEASKDKTAGDLVVAVTEAYGRLLVAQTAERAAAAAETSAAEDVSRGRRRRDAGALTDGDVLALVVHAAEVSERHITAGSNAGIARANLNRLLGAPIDQTYDAQEPAGAATASGSNTTVALSREPERARPELRLAEAAQALAEDRARMARAAWVPQVAAQAGYELGGTQFHERASAWVVGGELRWSLSTGGAERAQMRAAAAAMSRARYEQEAARSAVQMDLVAARQQLMSARARADVGRAAVDAAQESQRIVRERFAAGLASVTDVLRASAAALDAEVRRVTAVVDGAVAEAQLARALGQVVP